MQKMQVYPAILSDLTFILHHDKDLINLDSC